MSRSPDEYDDYEDRERPRRRREYEEDDYDRPRRPERAGLDGTFLDTNLVVLILFAVCCNLIALILSIVELATGRDPEAKQRATTVLVIAIIVNVIGAIVWVVALANQPAGGVRRF
jgi:hypothetical protein